ncbi:monocarboxylate transporter 12-like [Patiria miniata]|uniref:Major facilitator superfamily (MFS) profile domain-containing protein n=1 Tax=Patiria miniata TaxID=46514 RepID=A0A914ASQ6_PATMI|nr:monocarboxylate transporter 12-like [Patiria miniata]
MGDAERCSYRCWHAVLGLRLHVDWLLWAGLLKGLGMMLPTLKEQFTAETWMIGWLIATFNGAASFTAPLSVPLEDKFGTRAVVTVSGFLVGTSMILSSFSNTAIQMMLTSLITGPGLSIVNVLARAAMGRYFTTNYTSANGIGTSGHAVAMILIAPITLLLLDTYEWRGALVLLGALYLHLGVCGLLLTSSPIAPTQAQDEYLPIISSEEEKSPPDKASHDTKNAFKLSNVKGAIWAHRNLLLGCQMCWRVEFWIVSLVYGCAFFVSSLWLIYFVAYTEAKGFSGYEAVTFTMAGGIGNLVLKIMVGVIVDRGLLKLRLSMSVMIIVNSVALLVLPWMNSYWLMVANAFIFNGFNGALSSLIDIYTRELLGAEDLLSAFSLMDLVATAFQQTLGFFPGWMFDRTGSYDTAFVILGCVAMLPLVAPFMERVLNRWNWKEQPT